MGRRAYNISADSGVEGGERALYEGIVEAPAIEIEMLNNRTGPTMGWPHRVDSAFTSTVVDSRSCESPDLGVTNS